MKRKELKKRTTKGGEIKRRNMRRTMNKEVKTIGKPHIKSKQKVPMFGVFLLKSTKILIFFPQDFRTNHQQELIIHMR